MLVDELTSTDLPLEVRAGRALRSSAARRARLARRRRGRRQRLVLVAIVVCGLIAVPATGDASGHRISTPRPASRCSLPGTLRKDFVVAAEATGLPLSLLASVAHVESRFRLGARSPAGAIGVMQLMPSTASSLHLDARKSSSNVLAGASYLRQLLSRYAGNVRLALAAYNAGPTAVDRAGGVPSAETRGYVAEVERTWRGYGACA